MKKLFITLLVCLGALTAYSQVNTTNVEIYQDKETGKYGYKYEGNIIIPAKYDAVEWPNVQGLLRVYMAENYDNESITQSFVLYSLFNFNGYFGYLDLEGNVVVPVKYGWLDYLGGRYIGYIDKNKQTNRYAAFSEGDSKNGYTTYRTKKYGIIDIDGNIVLKPKFDYLTICSDSIFMAKTPTFDSEGIVETEETFYVNIQGERLDQTNFDFIKSADKIASAFYIEKDGLAQIIGLHFEPLTISRKINKGREAMEQELTELFTRGYYDSEFRR